MKPLVVLKVIVWLLMIFMIWKIIDTSMTSNLFEEWDYLGQIPWMEATLYDFYVNVFAIYLWVLYKEKSVFKKIFWLVFLVSLGSVATCIYLLKELHGLAVEDDVKTLIMRQNN